MSYTNKIIESEDSLCRLFVGVSLLLIPLLLWGLGLYPADDALRHIGIAVSGKSWEDVLLFRSGFDGSIYTHPAWEGGLRLLVKMGVESDLLILISIFSPWAFLGVVLLLVTKKPETILVVLLAILLAGEGQIGRLFLGRPFALAAGCTVLLFWLTTDRFDKLSSIKYFIFSVSILTVQYLFHPSYYLSLLPIGCIFIFFVIAKKYIKAASIVAAFPVALVIAALLSGNFWAFISNNFLQAYWAFVEDDFSGALVGEFLPWSTPSVIGIAVIFQFAYHFIYKNSVLRPEILITFIGFILGQKVSRFWADWGLMGYIFWLIRDFEILIERYSLNYSGVRRVCIVAMLSGAFLIIYTTVMHRTFDKNASEDLIGSAVAMAEYSEWLPEDGGIIYSPDMRAFYTLLYTYPNENWKYTTGFERALMEDSNRKVLSDWYQANIVEAFIPWYEKLTPADRLIFGGRPEALLSLEEEPYSRVEWKSFGKYFWVGKLKTISEESEDEATESNTQ